MEALGTSEVHHMTIFFPLGLEMSWFQSMRLILVAHMDGSSYVR